MAMQCHLTRVTDNGWENCTFMPIIRLKRCKEIKLNLPQSPLFLFLSLVIPQPGMEGYTDNFNSLAQHMRSLLHAEM